MKEYDLLMLGHSVINGHFMEPVNYIHIWEK